MSTLHKGQNEIGNTLASKEGQRKRLLCSNKVGIGCPSLDFDSSSEFATKDALVKELARILVYGFLEMNRRELKEKRGQRD